ncbi:uracil/xanthine transporter [Alicyclobacillus sp.]|uniref:uracil/xanthine transporter n=1 Tax=Alicyclobacillus sp. TaxID=61169 RepID=UPI0025B97E67|nr:uracil/xanthine transporter [Alicyclobacillus sp.]MCL6516309.1 uracil/xanthine transporter [Alicyclobacillus sp.]
MPSPEGIRKTALVQGFAGIQWLVFMFANIVVIPLSVGSAFHLDPGQMAGALSRAFMLTGIACLAQALFGHRLPLMEGQSGMWWGVILNLCATASESGLTLADIGGSIALGVTLGGVLVAVCGLVGIHRWLNRLFTPVVMAVLLFLLASQLIDIFFHGMVGLAQGPVIRPGVAALSILLVIGVSALTIAGRGLLSNFAILIGLAVGWAAYVLCFGTATAVVSPHWTQIADVFTWGHPVWHTGIIIACVVTALINSTNTIATLRAAEPLFDLAADDRRYRRSFVVTGLFTAASGPLAQVPYAPYTSSIGFLRTTRLLDRGSFIIGAALFLLIGAIPPVTGFFSTLPVSVGDSVLFVAYLQLFGSALQNLEGIVFNFRTIFRVAAPTLLGLAILATPAAAFTSLPGFIQTIAGNGMLMGILTAVLLEALVPWDRLR